MNYYTKDTLFGQITITEEKGFVTSLIFGEYKGKSLYNRFFLSETLENAFSQLEEYMQGIRHEFDLPLNPNGTKFQQKVWSALLEIPYGETRCYKDIAQRIGNSNASRAVGTANHKNNIPIFIPCHRVISSDGSIGGYSGGTEIKDRLLKLEFSNI